MDDIVLMGDPRVAEIEVEESGEPLVAVEGVRVSAHRDDLGPDRSLLRASVAARLQDAAGPCARRDPAPVRRGVACAGRAAPVLRGLPRKPPPGRVSPPTKTSSTCSPAATSPHRDRPPHQRRGHRPDALHRRRRRTRPRHRGQRHPGGEPGRLDTAAPAVSAEGRAVRHIVTFALTLAGLGQHPTELSTSAIARPAVRGPSPPAPSKVVLSRLTPDRAGLQHHPPGPSRSRSAPPRVSDVVPTRSLRRPRRGGRPRCLG